MKNPFPITDDNKTILIGLLSIFTALWTVLYLIPDFLISLFNTFLGNMILLIVVILVASKDIKYGAILFVILLVLAITNYRLRTTAKEGFSWTPDSKQKFIEMQQLVNPNLVYDLNKTQEQATQEEVDYYLENGKWPWSQEAQDLYLDAISKNVFVRQYPLESLNQAMKIYNEKIILDLISYQAKEGQFLLNGIIIENDKDKERDGAGSYGRNSGLETKSTSTKLIKCSSISNEPEIVRYTGDEGILGSHMYDTKEITDYSQLEKLIPGFQFFAAPCNPCLNIRNTQQDDNDKSANPSCPFTFEIKNQGSEVSRVWKYLWSLP
jgi:hypothetical protein